MQGISNNIYFKFGEKINEIAKGMALNALNEFTFIYESPYLYSLTADVFLLFRIEKERERARGLNCNIFMCELTPYKKISFFLSN